MKNKAEYKIIFQGADAIGKNWSCLDISGWDLRHSNFSNADLTHIVAVNVDLRCANLSNADLSGADLSGANLTGANLTNAILTGAILRGTDFTNARRNT